MHGDHRELPVPEQDAHRARRRTSWASPTRSSTAPTSSSARWTGSARWSPGRSPSSAPRSTAARPGTRPLARGRAFADSKVFGASPGPYRALELMAAAKTADRTEAYAAEDEALADLIMGDELRASLYAFELVRKRARKPAGAPDPSLARPVTKIGVVGAGLMASQLALLFLRRTPGAGDHHRPRPGAGRRRSWPGSTPRSTSCWPRSGSRPARPTGCGRSITRHDRPRRLRRLRLRGRGGVRGDRASSKQVFAELEQHVGAGCVLATNTSSLSVTEMAADLHHPERVVGFHFFNPVAVMPLLEVIRGPQTDDATTATALGAGQGDPEERGAGARTPPASWSTGCCSG